MICHSKFSKKQISWLSSDVIVVARYERRELWLQAMCRENCGYKLCAERIVVTSYVQRELRYKVCAARIAVTRYVQRELWLQGMCSENCGYKVCAARIQTQSKHSFNSL